MRVSTFVPLLLLVLAPYNALAADSSPRPSDTNNQPATPAPPPGSTPKPSSPPPGPSTPAPAPSTTSPTPSSSSAAPTSNPPPPATTSAAPSSSAPPPSTTPVPSTATPEPTTAAAVVASSSSPSATSTSTASAEPDSSGMGAGAIVGIVLACVGLVGIIAFFAYRHFRARREDAQNYDMELGGPSPALESAHDAKMYASLDMPKQSRQTTATATPTDDIVIMTKYATPASPKFANPPQLSPPPFSHHDVDDVADFTKSTNNFDQSRGPAAAAVSTEFSHSYREGSYAESYAESYAGGTSYGGGSFMNSFDHGMLGRETFRDTLTDAENAATAAVKANPAEPSNGLAGLETGKDNTDSHWMEAMDEMRDTNDSYAMLEAGGSYNSRGSAMRFSTESDIRG